MRRDPRAVGWIMGVGTLVSGAALVAGPAADLLVLCGLLVAGIAGLAAVSRTPIHRGVVRRFAVVGACFAVPALLTAIFGDRTDAVEQGFVLLGTGSVVVAVVHLIHLRHPHATAGLLGDAVIVGMGGWIVTWIALVRPLSDRSDIDPWVGIIASISQPLGLVALLFAVMLLVTERVRRPVEMLIGSSIVIGLVTNFLGSLDDAQQIHSDLSGVCAALFLVGTTLFIAALHHPSVVTLTVAQPSQTTPRAFGRLVVTTIAVAVPLVVLAVTEPAGVTDRLVRSISACVLALAVMLRVLQSLRAARTAQDHLLRSAQTDPLTGLPNRALLLAALEQSLLDSWYGEQRPTVYFVDLDRFKNINDSLGHAAGDHVLRTIAERLLQACPERAMVARLSGDEYVVLDPHGGSDEVATTLTDRLLDVFREPLALDVGDVFVTASLGIATVSANTRTSAEDLLRHADTAMYRAKDAGRNCVAFYDDSMHERVAQRLALETGLYRALARHELRLFHQPILDIESGEMIGFEALMRWQRDDGATISPAEFIPVAEDTGTIVPIGSWALHEALGQLRTWIDEGVCPASATMSVNVSPRQLADDRFPAVVADALQRAGVAPRALWLEITESVMITDPQVALESLQRLTDLGVRIALDDFGTGYSSLSLLQRFPLQRIKIDRAFVHGVADRESDRSLVRTIVAMGTSLGLDLVAEGVETVQQLQVLRDLGCRKAQGYLISHPVPADAMPSTVAALARLGRSPVLRERLLTR
jgi:diguanylate cyclase (GGDEF)-like protein